MSRRPPPATASAHHGLDLPGAVGVDARAEVRYRVREAVTDTHRVDPRCEVGGELVEYALVHEEPVRAYARLPGVAELRDHCAPNGRLDVGIGEDDERASPPSSSSGRTIRALTSRMMSRPTGVDPAKATTRTGRVVEQSHRGRRGGTVHQAEDTGRQAGLVDQPDHLPRG